MASKAPLHNIDESKLTVTKPKTKAVGIPAVVNSLKISLEQMGPLRSVQTLLAVNQVDGFDCMGCAWPEHEKRNAAEFCENGAKAVAEEGTRRRVTPRVLRQTLHRGPENAGRLLAGPAGPADPPDAFGRGTQRTTHPSNGTQPMS